MPRHFIFFDTETKDKKLNDVETELLFKIGCGAYYDFNRNSKPVFCDFDNLKTFWDFVFKYVRNKQTLYIISHNLPFDFRVAKGFKEMTKRKMTQDKIIFEGTTNIFSFSKDTSRLIFLDNMNYFKLPLKILGHNIGIEKLDIEKDNLKIYCKRDVEILIKAWQLLLNFINNNDLGNFAPTIAGQSFNAFRHKFMSENIYIHVNENIIDDERMAYHGGRTECFKLGKIKGNSYMYDFNSMYPSVMRDFEYPKKYLTSAIYPTKNKLKQLVKDYCLIAKCKVEVKEPVFPKRENGKLIFPIGCFETYLTTREIQYALENKIMILVSRIHIYEKANLFKDYVDFFYKLKVKYRNENNDSFCYLCKLFLNSLYGKFGQRNKQYELSNQSFPVDGQYYEVETKQLYRVINGKTEKLTGLKEGVDSFVSIPAHITADARMKLWKLIKKLGRQNVFYCDTDSVITSKRMNETKELGGVSLKDKSNHLVIYGNKDYEFGKDIVMKGIKKDAIKINGNEFRQVQFEGLAGAIANDRINSVIIKNINKKLKRNYDKGLCVNNIILPYKLPHLNLKIKHLIKTN